MNAKSASFSGPYSFAQQQHQAQWENPDAPMVSTCDRCACEQVAAVFSLSRTATSLGSCAATAP